MAASREFTNHSSRKALAPNTRVAFFFENCRRTMPRYQGAGIGRRLLHAVIEEGRSAGTLRLYLETNHVLKPAIRLYESAGFKHMDASRITPSPYARADIYMELILV
jgi:GNAT superfamily N-acetyltransferase